jgi:hypothetical protein
MAKHFERVIQVEFNELVPRLMDQWIADGSLPNFKVLRDRSWRYISEADVSTPRELEPWIQWYSIHTGLSYHQHGVFHLTDGPRAKHETIFDVLGRDGLKLGCCGSMNVRRFSGGEGFFVADPWCDSQSAHPESLNTFQRFVSQYVREYTNPEGSGSAISPARFLSFMAAHGLNPRTVVQAVSQLAQERLTADDLTWRRSAVLDRLYLDLFKHLYRRHRPDYATFFSNSTAHLQHAYWRHMEPEPFKIRPTDAEIRLYGSAVKFGYVMMDRMLREIVSLAGPNDLIILATALSQQPFLRKEDEGGQLFYRPRDIKAFLRRFGIEPTQVEPVMTHQFRLTFTAPDAMRSAAQTLESLHVDGTRLIHISNASESGFVLGCSISRQLGPHAQIRGGEANQAGAFFDLFYQIDGMKSGCHHSDGILWLATGEGRDQGRCSILDIFPTTLAALGRGHLVPADCPGRSLLDEISVARPRPLQRVAAE